MKVIVIGSSGHAKVIIDAINKSNHYEVIGLLDDFRVIGETTLGVPVIGKIADAIIHDKTGCSWIIGVGDNYQRHAIHSRLMELRLNYINVIHSSAIMGSDVDLGVGNFIAAGSIINSGTRIGNHCIINTGAQLDHDNTLGGLCIYCTKGGFSRKRNSRKRLLHRNGRKHLAKNYHWQTDRNRCGVTGKP